MTSAGAPPLEAFLPHRGPMLLLDGVEEADALGGIARVRLSPKAWYADAAGRTPAWFALEFMAQAVAACRGRWAFERGDAPRGGYLVGTRGLRCAVPDFPPEAELRIRVRRLEEDPSGLCLFQCEVSARDSVLAEAILKVMER